MENDVRVIPREADVAQPALHQIGAPQATPSYVGEWLKGDTNLLVWLVFLALGGGIIALYYSRIHYMPDIEWSTSIVYLAVASFIGGGIGLLFALSLLLPGVIWAECLLCDPGLVNVFCFDHSREVCLRTILRYLGLPFGIVMLASHVALKADEIVGLTKGGVILYSVIALMLLIGTFVVMKLVFARLLTDEFVYDSPPVHASPPVELDIGSEKGRRIFMYSAWFTLSVSLSQISMLLVYRLSGAPGQLSFCILTIICTAAVVISNHIVAIRYRRYPRQAVAASLVAALVLLFVADGFSSLSEGIMDFYGFGRNHKANLLVNEDGLAIIDKLGLPDEYKTPSREGLRNVEILSKVGSEYYLRVGNTEGFGGRTFTLPKATVKSVISTEGQ